LRYLAPHSTIFNQYIFLVEQHLRRRSSCKELISGSGKSEMTRSEGPETKSDEDTSRQATGDTTNTKSSQGVSKKPSFTLFPPLVDENTREYPKNTKSSK
jgi:hypothetical protein